MDIFICHLGMERSHKNQLKAYLLMENKYCLNIVLILQSFLGYWLPRAHRTKNENQENQEFDLIQQLIGIYTT